MLNLYFFNVISETLKNSGLHFGLLITKSVVQFKLQILIYLLLSSYIKIYCQSIFVSHRR